MNPELHRLQKLWAAVIRRRMFDIVNVLPLKYNRKTIGDETSFHDLLDWEKIKRGETRKNPTQSVLYHASLACGWFTSKQADLAAAAVGLDPMHLKQFFQKVEPVVRKAIKDAPNTKETRSRY